MNKQIYVKNKKKVDIYQLTINVKELDNIVKKIDDMGNKGIMKTVEGTGFPYGKTMGDLKIEIIKKEFVKSLLINDYDFGDTYNLDLYKYAYYAFRPTELSKLVTTMIEEYNSLNLSIATKKLLNYKPDITDDQKNVNLYLSTVLDNIEFKKINDSQAKRVKLPIQDEKKSRLFKKTNYRVPVDYYNGFNYMLKNLELENTEFYNSLLFNDDFNYNDDQKEKIKIKIMSNIPNSDEIKSRLK